MGCRGSGTGSWEGVKRKYSGGLYPYRPPAILFTGSTSPPSGPGRGGGGAPRGSPRSSPGRGGSATTRRRCASPPGPRDLHTNPLRPRTASVAEPLHPSVRTVTRRGRSSARSRSIRPPGGEGRSGAPGSGTRDPPPRPGRGGRHRCGDASSRTHPGFRGERTPPSPPAPVRSRLPSSPRSKREPWVTGAPNATRLHEEGLQRPGRGAELDAGPQGKGERLTAGRGLPGGPLHLPGSPPSRYPPARRRRSARSRRSGCVQEAVQEAVDPPVERRPVPDRGGKIQR
jgi:hypothetical protein